MDKLALILAVAQLVISVAGIALLIAGLYASIKDIRYINKEDPEDEEAHSKASFKKGLILTGCGVAVYAVSRFCGNYCPMTEQGFDFFVILLQSLWDGVRSFGFLVVFPFIIRQWRKTARRKALTNQ